MIWKLAAAAVGIAVAATAMARERGTVDGALRIGDETVALTHVYAREMRAIPEMVSRGRPAQRLSLLLLDRPLPADGPTAAPFLSQLLAHGQSRGLVVELDPLTGAVIGGNAVLAPRRDPQVLTQTPGAVFLRTEGFAVSGGMVRGRIRSEPDEIVGPDGGPGGSYSFDVSLSAPVEPAPRPVATLEDDRAQASAPAQSFAQFLGAVVAGDVDGVRAGIASHRCRSMVTPEVLPQFRAMLLAGRPDAATLLADLRKVYLYETRADLFFESAVGGTAVPMVHEFGAWKLGE
jgi:hypothetical protein